MRSLSGPTLRTFPLPSYKKKSSLYFDCSRDYLKYIRCNNGSLFAHRTNTERFRVKPTVDSHRASHRLRGGVSEADNLRELRTGV